MSVLSDLERWKAGGTITDSQHQVLVSLVRKDRFSVFAELNALLYLGVVAFVAGAGWTIQTHFARLGDLAILFTLTVSFAGSLCYCFTRGGPYSNTRQQSPTLAFDYVLYLGCLMLGLEFGFIEYRFHLMQDNNKPYLGWERHAWDPMLLGVTLMAVALGLRRWLSGGRDAARHGFTATRTVVGKDPVLSVLSAAPFPIKAHTHAPAPPAPSGFDGGRSGGVGGGGSF